MHSIALSEGLQGVDIIRVPNTTRRLHAVHVISPPWATTPPQGANPRVGVGSHVLKHTGNSGLALLVGATGEFANDSLLPVRLQPFSRSLDALLADRGRDTILARSGSVGIEILMHLVDDLVRRVGQSGESVIAGCGPENVRAVLKESTGGLPSPGTAVGGSLDEDGLGSGTSGTDTVDAALVQLNNELDRWHVVGLVVAVEDNIRVRRKFCGNGLPPRLKPSGVCDDLPVVSCEVVGVDNRVCSLASDVADNLFEVSEVGCVRRSSQRVGDQALHHESNAEDVHPISDERVDGCSLHG